MQTRDERVKLVYKVKIALDNADGLFKPGHAGRGAARSRRRGRDAADDPRPRSRRSTRRYADGHGGRRRELRGPAAARCSASSGRTAPARRPRCAWCSACSQPDAGRVTHLRARPARRAARALGPGRLPVAALLALRRPHASTRTSRSSPRSTACAGWPAQRDELLELVRMTPFRDRLADAPLGRHEAEARARLHARPHAGAARARRAHDRRRPRLAPRLLAAPGAAAARGADDPAHDALPRRGRALPARRAHRPRAHADRRHARRAARGRAGCRWSSSWSQPRREGRSSCWAAPGASARSEPSASGSTRRSSDASRAEAVRAADALGAELRAAGLDGPLARVRPLRRSRTSSSAASAPATRPEPPR